MNKPTLHIISAKEGSIGEITSDLIPCFRNFFNITIEGEEEPKDYKTLLCHFINPAVVRHESFKKFKKKILIQPIDGTSIERDIIGLLNQFDLIITPGLAGKHIMTSQGVTIPIEVIPNFYKDDLLTKLVKTKIKEFPKDKVFFYHESTFHPRKGTDILCEAFIKAFSNTEYANKVVLILKDSAFNERTFQNNEVMKEKIISLQTQYKQPASIIKISQHLKPETLKRVWSNIHIYVSLAKIEGFGIPLLRMAVLQKPIITLDCPVSGYLDFLNKDNSYLIPAKIIKAEDEFMFLYKKDTKWGIPKNVNYIIDAFKLSLEDYLKGNLKLVDLKALEYMHIDNIVQKYITVIKKL